MQLTGNPVQAAGPALTIHHIAVTDGDHDLDVAITASAPITPVTQTVAGPDRLVVDFPDALPSAGLHNVLVNRGNLRDIRVGLLSTNPPVTRVVLDLTSPTQYRVSPSGNTIVVKLDDESGPVAVTANPPAEATPQESTSVAEATPQESTSVNSNPPPVQSHERGPARWIFPILFTTAVLAMLTVALVSHVLNKRGSRGL